MCVLGPWEQGCSNAVSDLVRCLSPLSPKLSLVGRVYSWMGDHLAWYSLVLILELGTHVNRVVVVGLSRASRVFFRVLRFSSLRKINT